MAHPIEHQIKEVERQLTVSEEYGKRIRKRIYALTKRLEELKAKASPAPADPAPVDPIKEDAIPEIGA